jgi:hypothetical protein
MTEAGLEAARRFGRELPEFTDLAAAERALFGLRDDLLAKLVAASRASPSFSPDYGPESLKALERWYYELADGPGFGSIGLDPETFGRAMAMYLGEVAVRTVPAFEWFVAEFAFLPGRYEIGVRRPLLALMLTRPLMPPRDRNRRRQSLWRRYRSMLPSG